MAVEILKNTVMNQHPNAPVETSQSDNDALKKAFEDLKDEDPEKDIKDSELEIPQ